MSVIPLTVFFSLLLAGVFVVLFARDQRRRPFTSPERDSLLPLADETSVLSRGAQVPPDDHGHADHALAGHRPGDGRCGCHDSRRSPCAGCLKPADEDAYF